MSIIIIIIITSSIQIPNETCNTIFISPWQYHVISYHWQKHDYFTMAMACFPYHHAMFMSPRHHHVYLIIATSCSSHYGNTMFICPWQHQCLPHHDNAILIAPGHIYIAMFITPWQQCFSLQNIIMFVSSYQGYVNLTIATWCLSHHDNTFISPWQHLVYLTIATLWLARNSNIMFISPCLSHHGNITCNSP